ncbi:hypothetical protein F5B20DRAFT_579405 [Whalleya microplaca]|nr:hypothetical protein F5B20DRAFT_579405 [Whalleya microplaca]
MADEVPPIPVGEQKTKHKKKRSRDPDGQDRSERRHKKSKSSSNAVSLIERNQAEAPAHKIEQDVIDSRVGKKRKRSTREGNATENDNPIKPNPEMAADSEIPESQQADHVDSGKPRKEKKSRKRERKREQELVLEPTEADEAVASSKDAAPSSRDSSPAAEAQLQNSIPNSLDLQATPAKPSNGQVFGRKPDADFPFFTQIVSQYLPLFPSGLMEPLEGYADQHLKPLLNHYVHSFRGVLLAYRNPRLGEAPGKASLSNRSAQENVVLLESINEYAVSFSWLTVDVVLFRPARGAWMEGVVNLQGEGHIGVVCWDKFNASIEAGRLLRGWRWVDLMSKGREKTKAESKIPTPEPFEDNPEAGDGTQMHTAGYWVDEAGTRLRGGAKISFRIRNYEVGVSGDYGYLSIEGTMLDEEEEKAKFAEEMEDMRRRKLRNPSVSRRHHKRVPEFSMTKFGGMEEEENALQRAPILMATRANSDSE